MKETKQIAESTLALYWGGQGDGRMTPEIKAQFAKVAKAVLSMTPRQAAHAARMAKRIHEKAQEWACYGPITKEDENCLRLCLSEDSTNQELGYILAKSEATHPKLPEIAYWMENPDLAMFRDTIVKTTNQFCANMAELTEIFTNIDHQAKAQRGTGHRRKSSHEI